MWLWSNKLSICKNVHLSENYSYYICFARNQGRSHSPKYRETKLGQIDNFVTRGPFFCFIRQKSSRNLLAQLIAKGKNWWRIFECMFFHWEIIWTNFKIRCYLYLHCMRRNEFMSIKKHFMWNCYLAAKI